jgi:peptidoglycan hydrolase CwlO-like protein
MTDPLPVILLVAGLIVGGLIGFMLAARKGRDAQARADAAGRIEAELRGQVQQREAELVATRDKLSEAEKKCATAGAEAKAATQRLAEQQQQQAQALADLKAAQEKALSDLREAFAALSAKALRETQPEFLRLARRSDHLLNEAQPTTCPSSSATNTGWRAS